MHPLALTAAVCLIPLTASGTRWAWLAPGASERAARAAAQELAGQVLPVLWSLAGTVNGVPAMAHDLARDLERDLGRRLQVEVRHAVDQLAGPEGQIAGLRGDFRGFTTDLTGRVAALGAKLDPAVANVNAASEELPPAVRDLRITLARAGRTMGNVDGVTAKVNAAVPQFLSIAAATGLKIQETSDESAQTARQTRIFMGHLAEATKPLPAWARIGLAVAPPVVQTGFTVGSWLALRGKAK